MYGKLFAQMYTGSMVGAGTVVFAVWPYALANCDKEGRVELNPKLLAMLLGDTSDRIQQAIDFLLLADPDSRSQAEEGCRLVQEGQFLYRIVNFAKYRAIRNQQDRREYQREWDRKNRPSGHQRAKKDKQPDTVRHSPTSPTNTEAEANTDVEAARQVESIEPGANESNATSRSRKEPDDQWPAPSDGGFDLKEKLALDSTRLDYRQRLRETLRIVGDQAANRGLSNFETWLTENVASGEFGRDVYAIVMDIAEDCVKADVPYAAFISRVQARLDYEPPSRQGGEAV